MKAPFASATDALFKTLGIAFTVMLLAACDHDTLVSSDLSSELAPESRAYRAAQGAAKAKMPLRGDGTTDQVAVEMSDACPLPNNFLVTQIGSGHIRGMGPVEIFFQFCTDVSNFPTIPYHSGTGTLTARSGHQLRMDVSGTVLPDDDDGDQFELRFEDTFPITDGTGRFRRASGWVRFDSQVDRDFVLDDGTTVTRTFHQITGKINPVGL